MMMIKTISRPVATTKNITNMSFLGLGARRLTLALGLGAVTGMFVSRLTPPALCAPKAPVVSPPAAAPAAKASAPVKTEDNTTKENEVRVACVRWQGLGGRDI
jgi:hypothetical protein